MKKIILAFIILLFNLNYLALAADNYAATAGSGLIFGAKDAAGVLYSRFIGCDNTTVSQCWAVDASGRLTVNLAASSTITVTQATASSLNATVVGTGTFAVQAAQSGTWTVQPGNTANTTAWLTNNSAADPCQTTVNSTARINIGSATTTRIIAPSASNKTYICSVDLFAFAANNVAIVEGTGGTCGSGTAGVVGGTTTATGISFPAQGGLVKGGAGVFVWNTAGTNVDFCLITSTTGPLTGFVKYVQAP